MEEENIKNKVTVRPLNRFNWEIAVQLRLHDYQEDYMPDNLTSIAQSKFENLTPNGIFVGEKMVGFTTFGNFGGVFWINRIMVDKDSQKHGYGRKALGIILDKLKTRPDCSEVRTSFVHQNALAEYFFSQSGFKKITEGLEGEIVMRWLPS